MASEQHIKFTKMTAAGNDFIIIDNRLGLIDSDSCGTFVKLACRRKLSVGADGVILIEKDPQVDFKWRFFNADGSEAEMCGNGARCAARFAHLYGIVSSSSMSFRTLAGIIEARIMDTRAKIKVTAPRELKMDFTLTAVDRTFDLSFVNTGVPHTVCFMEKESDLENADIFNWGRALRFHSHFQPAGSNVNFALVRDSHSVAVRTYERGVEAETLACGTGSIATALIAAAKQLVFPPVKVQTRGGEVLTIHFDSSPLNAAEGTLHFESVYLEGDAKIVYEAELWNETLAN